MRVEVDVKGERVLVRPAELVVRRAASKGAEERYVATIHTITSAVIKLSREMPLREGRKVIPHRIHCSHSIASEKHACKQDQHDLQWVKLGPSTLR